MKKNLKNYLGGGGETNFKLASQAKENSINIFKFKVNNVCKWAPIVVSRPGR
jgi:hypothetical protein